MNRWLASSVGLHPCGSVNVLWKLLSSIWSWSMSSSNIRLYYGVKHMSNGALREQQKTPKPYTLFSRLCFLLFQSMKRSLWLPVDSTVQKRYFSGRPNLVQGWALRSPLWRARTTIFLLPLFFFFLPLLSMLTAVTSASNKSLKNSFLSSSSFFNQCNVVQKSWGFGLYNGMPFPLHWKVGAQSEWQM